MPRRSKKPASRSEHSYFMEKMSRKDRIERLKRARKRTRKRKPWYLP